MTAIAWNRACLELRGAPERLHQLYLGESAA